MKQKFLGYRRDNGTVGVRNHVLILPTTVCASHVARRIAEEMREAVPLCHEHGCPDAWKDYERECDWCGAKFMPDNPQQAFCDDDCGKAYWG